MLPRAPRNEKGEVEGILKKRCGRREVKHILWRNKPMWHAVLLRQEGWMCARGCTRPPIIRACRPLSLFALFTKCSATNFIPSCLYSTRTLSIKMELQRKLFYPAWLPSLSCVMRQQQTLLAHWVTKHNAYFLIKCVSLPWQNFNWRKLTLLLRGEM